MSFKLVLFAFCVIGVCKWVQSDLVGPASGPLKGFTKFATNFYAKSANHYSGNIIMSPFSTQTALLLLYMGADGETAKEISTAFDLGEKSRSDIAATYTQYHRFSEGNTLLKVANRIYLGKEYSVNPAFNDIAFKTFKSEAVNIDFKGDAAQEINNFVEKQTNDKIKNIFKSSDFESTNTSMVLANAVYFKGEWKEEFDAKLTHPEKFWNSDTETVEVPMMETTQYFKYGYFGALGLRSIELYYKDTDITMMILLPLENAGLSALERNLQNIDIFELSNNSSDSKSPILLPKFKIETEIDLSIVLSEMGVSKLFTEEANFKDILEPSTQIRLNKAVHKAFIEIDEKGAEAAASSGFVIGDSPIPGPKQEPIRVDHPFMYIIKNPQNILFMGSVRKM